MEHVHGKRTHGLIGSQKDTHKEMNTLKVSKHKRYMLRDGISFVHLYFPSI